jgi:YbgC/YbaW family acyl-CoA thioester hydrolase
MENKKILKSSHKVVSYELDSYGHVNNAVWLNYLEKARNDYMTLKGLCFKDFHKWKRFPIVIKASLEYKSPAFADDNLVINGWISSHSAIRFTLQYEVLNQDTEKLLLTGETTHVFIDDKNKPARIPQDFSEKFLK